MEASHGAFTSASDFTAGAAGIFLGPAWFIVCGLGAIMGGLLLHNSSFTVPMLMLGSGTALLGILMLYRNVAITRRRRSALLAGGANVAVGAQQQQLAAGGQEARHTAQRAPRVYSLVLEAPPSRREAPGSQLLCGGHGLIAPTADPLLEGAVVLGVPEPPAPGPGAGAPSDLHKDDVAGHRPAQQPQQQAAPPPSPHLVHVVPQAEATTAAAAAAASVPAPLGRMVLVVQPHPELLGYRVEMLERLPSGRRPSRVKSRREGQQQQHQQRGQQQQGQQQQRRQVAAAASWLGRHAGASWQRTTPESILHLEQRVELWTRLQQRSQRLQQQQQQQEVQHGEVQHEQPQEPPQGAAHGSPQAQRSAQQRQGRQREPEVEAQPLAQPGPSRDDRHAPDAAQQRLWEQSREQAHWEREAHGVRLAEAQWGQATAQPRATREQREQPGPSQAGGRGSGQPAPLAAAAVLPGPDGEREAEGAADRVTGVAVVRTDPEASIH